MQGPLADNLGEAENVRWITPDVFLLIQQILFYLEMHTFFDLMICR